MSTKSTETTKKNVFVRRVVAYALGLPATAALLVTASCTIGVAAITVQCGKLVSTVVSGVFGTTGKKSKSHQTSLLGRVLKTTRVVQLLEVVPDLGLPLGALAACFCHPFICWRKIQRAIEGHIVGEPALMQIPLKPGLSAFPPPSQKTLLKDAINVLEVVEVNGAKHLVRIRGHDRSNPLLIYLHGGPGMSEMLHGGADGGLRGEYLERYFCVCDYDQRSALGSGALNFAGNNGTHDSAFIDTLTVQQHIDDAVAICEWLAQYPVLLQARKKSARAYSNDERVVSSLHKVHLTGGSWGSVLALRTAAQQPSLFASPVVVRGLVTEQLESERRGCAYIRDCMLKEGRRTEDEIDKEMGALTGVPAGSYKYVGHDGIQQMLVQRRLLTMYGGQTFKEYTNFQRTNSGAPSWRLQFDKGWEVMLTPEISLAVVAAAKQNVVRTLEKMSNELWVGKCEQAKFVGGGLSVVVAHGIVDNCTGAAFVEKYMKDQLKVDEGCTKQLVWFQKSGHGVCKEEPAEYCALLRQVWGNIPAAPGTLLKECSYEVVTL